MKKNLKIAVVGGTGKSGKYLVSYLLNKGYALKLLVRNLEKANFNSSTVEIVEGNVCNYQDVHLLIKDCDAVVSTLGLGLPASEPTIFKLASEHIIKAMDFFGIRRYLVTTGLNVDTPFDQKTGNTLFGTNWMKENFPISTQNKQLEYETLVASNIDWTLLRLPLIEETAQSFSIELSLENCLTDKISATDLAIFLESQLWDEQYIKQAPFVFNV